MILPLSSAQARRMAPQPVIGEQETFTQPTLGVSLPLPEGWVLAEKNEQPLVVVTQTGKAETSAQLHAESRKLVHRLLVLNRFPRGAVGMENTIIVINAIPTGKEVTEQTAVQHQMSLVEKMKEAQTGFTLLAKPTETQIGNRSFSSMDNRLTLRNKAFFQRHYDRFEGDYILNIQIIASTEQDLAAADLLIKKLSFAEKAP
jgi:hypothetical protein